MYKDATQACCYERQCLRHAFISSTIIGYDNRLNKMLKKMPPLVETASNKGYV
jgi:hypothetical protein